MPSLKQAIVDQTSQNGYQTVPFGVYIHNLMFVLYVLVMNTVKDHLLLFARMLIFHSFGNVLTAPFTAPFTATNDYSFQWFGGGDNDSGFLHHLLSW